MQRLKLFLLQIQSAEIEMQKKKDKILQMRLRRQEEQEIKRQKKEEEAQRKREMERLVVGAFVTRVLNLDDPNNYDVGSGSDIMACIKMNNTIVYCILNNLIFTFSKQSFNESLDIYNHS